MKSETTILRKSPDEAEIRREFDSARDLVLKKNHDYGSAFSKTPILVPGMKASDAILVRMSDKIQRFTNLRGREAKVNDEALEDTLLDLANYCHLLRVQLKREKE